MSMNRIAKCLVGLAVASLAGISSSSADYLSNRTTDMLFAAEDFSTWTPRSGKMTYEKDVLQPEWGKGGRSKSYTVGCKTLQAIVGPNGRAKDGDTIKVSGKGPCNLTNLEIHKAVRIIPASMPTIRRPELVGEIDKKLANHHLKFPITMTCATSSAPCITVNIDRDKYAAIVGFHIKANSWLLAPLIESRSGGIQLKQNFIEGEVREFSGPQTQGMEQATAILIHGSNAIIEQNTIAHMRSGLAFIPTQRSTKGSIYKVSQNTIAQVDEAVNADGSIFASTRPGVKILVANNQIMARRTGIVNKSTAMTVTGNTFLQTGVHGIFIRGINYINKNVFKNAAFSSLIFVERPTAYIDQNLFEGNGIYSGNVSGMAIDGIEQIYMGRSPHPSGNICRNQPYGTFIKPPPHEIRYIDIETGSINPVSTFSRKKVSKRKLKKQQDAAQELWAAYNAYVAGLAEPEEGQKPYVGEDQMWGPFASYYVKSKEPIMAHILFERPDVNPAENYTACPDYSDVYKFGPGPESKGRKGFYSK
jgi:parallel beta helix pectate lyase-like protein